MDSWTSVHLISENLPEIGYTEDQLSYLFYFPIPDSFASHDMHQDRNNFSNPCPKCFFSKCECFLRDVRNLALRRVVGSWMDSMHLIMTRWRLERRLARPPSNGFTRTAHKFWESEDFILIQIWCCEIASWENPFHFSPCRWHFRWIRPGTMLPHAASPPAFPR